MRAFYMFLLILLNSQILPAQDTIHFKEGLMINGVHRYGREAVYTDHVLYHLYNNSLATPTALGGLDKAVTNSDLKWVAVKADSAHMFRLPRIAGQTYRGGGMFNNSSYLYVTYQSDKSQTAILNTRGSNAVLVNGEPHSGDLYASGWLYIPVQLKEGLNEFYIRSGFGTTASLIITPQNLLINTEDPTVPVLVAGRNNSNKSGAVVVINASGQPLQGGIIKAELNGKQVNTTIPSVPAMSSRKVAFNFDASGANNKGTYPVSLTLLRHNKKLDQGTVTIEVVNEGESYSETFVSEIDGSLQYYGVTEQSGGAKDNAALFLSVHGAGVEAIGQARAYRSKDWGTLITATNRRPRGFNWEDWGRLDAMEVLHTGKQLFKPDPLKIYLTGHSMGGHGTWYLGATYSEKWAAIAPCAGYPTLKEYGSHDGKIPDSTENEIERTLLRAGNQSDVIKLAHNYKPLGVYIFHGDSDRVVSVNYARQMRKVLGEFHPDFAYNEYPGGSHWFGDHSVDWEPLFSFFKSHTRLADSAVNQIDFKTSSPGISATYRWATIYQQQQPLQFSRIQLQRDLNSSKISGNTENVHLLKLALSSFKPGTTVTIRLDSLNAIQYTAKTASDTIFLEKKNAEWALSQQPDLFEKGPHRYGTFKEGFNNRMVFVYGTTGTKAENVWAYNKARLDAENWYYRGNGAVDIISDKEYNTGKYANRGVVLFGNATTNAAWASLLADAPIKVTRNSITLGTQNWQGDDLGAYFVWPLKSNPNASVSVVSGTGIKGLNAANANQYFAGGSGFPDYMIFRLSMLKDAVNGVETAGFFNNEWKIQ